MLNHSDGPLPRTSALRAFEAAARHGSFARAARELGLWQPAVSRLVAGLEHETRIRLFARGGRSVTLTPAGDAYRRGVAAGLERIAAAKVLAQDLADDRRVVVACGGSTSEMFLRPRLADLQRGLGGDASVRLLHCEEGHLDFPNVSAVDRIDLVAGYHDIEGAPGDEVAVFPEGIAPVCSPGFAAAHADVLGGPVTQWGSLAFLRFARPSLGWATWDDWFEAVGHPQPPPRQEEFDDYAYMISAAAAGRGLALGWRNFVGRHLDAGLLVVAAGGFVKTDRPFAVRLSGHGRQRPVARRCLGAFQCLASGKDIAPVNETRHSTESGAATATPDRSGGTLPRMKALRAFEAAARYRSFSRAAEELGIRQPAVSRYVSELERDFGTRLFERAGRSVALTPAGEACRRGVAAGLERIAAAARAARGLADNRQVIVTCSHEASHFLVMPRYAELRRALGGDVGIRILTYHYDARSLPADLAADIRLTWDPADAAPEDRVVTLREQVRPVCSPAYGAAHAEILAGPVAGWGGLTLLDLVRPNEGWASWDDWFAAAGWPDRPPRRVDVDSYAHVLEAAVAGHGVALGWRHFIERFLEAGELVALGDGFVGFDRAFYGVLTESGRRKPPARRCLEFLGQVHGT